jgi:hypothetical protein
MAVTAPVAALAEPELTIRRNSDRLDNRLRVAGRNNDALMNRDEQYDPTINYQRYQ